MFFSPSPCLIQKNGDTVIMNLRGYAEVVLLTFVALWDGGCSTIRNINLYSTSEEVQLGQSLDKEIQKQYTVLDDSRVNSFLQERGDKLVAVSNRADIKYKFVAVKDEAVNALPCRAATAISTLDLFEAPKPRPS